MSWSFVVVVVVRITSRPTGHGLDGSLVKVQRQHGQRCLRRSLRLRSLLLPVPPRRGVAQLPEGAGAKARATLDFRNRTTTLLLGNNRLVVCRGTTVGGCCGVV